MVLIDVAGWIEIFTGGPDAAYFAKPLEQPKQVLMPTACLWEIIKRVRELTDDPQLALDAAEIMMACRTVQLSPRTAQTAANMAQRWSISMPDAIILAEARARDAEIYTADPHFADLVMTGQRLAA
jgi:predicted nucleic acid-binding protein